MNSAEWKAEQDYREDWFFNPYPEGSNDWMDYEAQKKRILARVEMQELGELAQGAYDEC